MTSTVVASKQQVSCDVDDEAVLLSMKTGDYYGLNPVGTAIWRLVQRPRTLSELRDELLATYSDISPEECERAIVSFVAELMELDLIEAGCHSEPA
jgi:hypothetical protein